MSALAILAATLILVTIGLILSVILVLMLIGILSAVFGISGIIAVPINVAFNMVQDSGRYSSGAKQRDSRVSIGV